MENINNPAARLLTVLKQGKMKSYMDKQASEAWANILSVEPKNKSILLRRIGYVMALPVSIKENIEQLDDVDNALLLKWMPKVENAFSMLNFQTPWKSFISIMDEAVIYGIEICADTLSRKLPEDTVKEDDLSKLLVEADDLIEKLSSTNIDRELHDYIFENLLDIKNAIEEYRIRGIKPLKDKVHSTLGELYLTPEIYHKNQSDPIGKKFMKIMGGLAILVTVSNGCIQIGKDIVSLIPNDPKTQTTIENNIADTQADKAEPVIDC